MRKLNKTLHSAFRFIAICVVVYAIANHVVGWLQTNLQPPDEHLTLIETQPSAEPTHTTATQTETTGHFAYDTIPEPDGVTPYVVVNNNVPFFEETEINTVVFEEYAELDDLGRCGVAYANICAELMPTEKRGNISSVKPTGWVQNEYPDLISDIQLYNRCHLIGFQLAGENANKLNLITGTRYMNVTGMLVFENQVDDYIEENPNNHVLYRVTPVFIDDELVARGVLMEAQSVEDNGELQFCVFCYNIQPGIWIDYQTGENGAA